MASSLFGDLDAAGRLASTLAFEGFASRRIAFSLFRAVANVQESPTG
jgi:hypothetical protein